ncbi:hypothetical protein JW872_00690 [Candidatus Babeliales bacterium]|nr:hypothetical protein [Candidatus Babeliales bacterium]
MRKMFVWIIVGLMFVSTVVNCDMLRPTILGELTEVDLFHAIRVGDRSLVKECLKSPNIDKNIQVGKEQLTPLMFAVDMIVHELKFSRSVALSLTKMLGEIGVAAAIGTLSFTGAKKVIAHDKALFGLVPLAGHIDPNGWFSLSPNIGPLVRNGSPFSWARMAQLPKPISQELVKHAILGVFGIALFGIALESLKVAWSNLKESMELPKHYWNMGARRSIIKMLLHSGDINLTMTDASGRTALERVEEYQQLYPNLSYLVSLLSDVSRDLHKYTEASYSDGELIVMS